MSRTLIFLMQFWLHFWDREKMAWWDRWCTLLGERKNWRTLEVEGWALYYCTSKMTPIYQRIWRYLKSYQYTVTIYTDQMPIDPWRRSATIEQRERGVERARAQATMHDWFGMNGWNMCEEYILFTTIHEWRNNQILTGRAWKIFPHSFMTLQLPWYIVGSWITLLPS